MIKQLLIKGRQVAFIKSEGVALEQFIKVEQCKKFTKYIDSFQNDVEVRTISVLSVYMFGQNVGFVNLEVEAYLNEMKLPGYVFLRGDAVAVLLLVNGKMLLTKQFRVPVGRFTLEIPAGMLDESDNFSGVAAKEIKEETGISIEHNEMKYLQDMLVSPGGSDEVIHLFVVNKTIPNEQLDAIMLRTHGAVGEGEQIRLELQEFTWNNVLNTQDSKLIAAAASYLNTQ